MSSQYRDLHSNFIDSLNKINEKKVTHDDFVEMLPSLIQEINENFGNVYSLLSMIGKNSDSDEIKQILIKRIKKLERKVKKFVAYATNEEKTEEAEESEQRNESDDLEKVEEISAMGNGAASGFSYDGFKKYGKKKMNVRKFKDE